MAILLEKFGIEDDPEKEKSAEDQKGVAGQKSESKVIARCSRFFKKIGDGCERKCHCCFLKEDESEEDEE